MEKEGRKQRRGMSGQEGSSSPNIVTIVKSGWAVHVARTRRKRVVRSVGGETGVKVFTWIT
jgi:hypothetical protein